MRRAVEPAAAGGRRAAVPLRWPGAFPYVARPVLPSLSPSPLSGPLLGALLPTPNLNLLKALAAALLFLLALPAIAQDQPVLLRWQVPSDSALAFRTVMRAAEPDSSTGLASLIPSVERADMTSVLRGRPDGQIDVELIQGEVEFADDSTAALFEALRGLQEALGGTQLRGRITPSGAITSFWLPVDQKSLLALFFELPEDSVSVGDVWELRGTNLLSLRGPFQVEEANRSNEVRLSAVEERASGQVATLDYDLNERIAGSFGHMAFAFEGRGEFDVVAGTWRRFGGRMSIERTFMGAQSSSQVFALEPVTVPDER